METILLFCCKSCLKGGDNKEYYEVLGLTNNNVSADEIKKAYKKISLSLHPDKLAQRGIEITPEHKQQFLKVKEAHDVLSDPRRRRLYDQLGASGLKLLESPTEVNPTDIIKNFQNNQTDRNIMLLVILLIFASLFVLPVLFSLKCDGDINSVPWLALWTPMWIVDAVLFISSLALFTISNKNEEDENDNKANDNDISLLSKLNNFLSTVLFILIQVFILIRLDHVIGWNWFKVFIPWFLYEGLWIINYLPGSVIYIKKPDFDSLAKNLVNQSDVEHNDINDEIILEKMKLETIYFDLKLNQLDSQQKILFYLFRIWQAIFLALQLNGSVSWNWGLVFLPIWTYLFTEYLFIYAYRSWGFKTLTEIVITDEMKVDPIDALHYKQASGLISSSNTSCFLLVIPVYMSILLVSRLQLSVFSTFIILLPIFIILGCSCCCIFCGVISLASVDTDELEQAYKNADGYNTTNTASYNLEKKDSSNPGDYEPPVIESAYGTFAMIDQPIYVNGNENNNNANADSKEEVSAASVLIEID